MDWVSGYLPPNPVVATAYLLIEGALLLTLALFLSTRMPVIAAGVIGVAVFGAGWLAGVVGTLGTTFHISALRTVGAVGRVLIPTDGLWHGAIYYLEPSSLTSGQLVEAGNGPFYALAAPSWPYLLWVVCWFLIVITASVISFGRREL